ncbi:MAG: lipoprotein signal peptidase [Muribaculaceae bacterium]|nr:lipoprotein signal peptidase [Muribaculaceae bacterium]
MIAHSSVVRRSWLCALVIMAVILLDQAVKIWVKTRFYLGEDLEILPFFHLHFIQNNGMAFGWELGSKLFLTAFRVIMVGLLGWLLWRFVRDGSKPAGFLAALAAITAGAAGNIIDCVFYGEIFTNPWPPEIATFTEFGHGYGQWFQGLVVDMLWFPLFSFHWPQWMPFVGGEIFSFFDPVFNIADAAITVGVAVIILFYSRHIAWPSKEKE